MTLNHFAASLMEDLRFLIKMFFFMLVNMDLVH